MIKGAGTELPSNIAAFPKLLKSHYRHKWYVLSPNAIFKVRISGYMVMGLLLTVSAKGRLDASSEDVLPFWD